MTTRDLALDPVSGDLALSNNDLGLVGEGEAITQAIRLALGLFLGEWFLDQGAGIPYFERVFVKAPDLLSVRETFRNALLAVVGVREVVELSVLPNLATRATTVSFRVSTDVGELSFSEAV
jgi:hypothetical protein